MTRMSMEERRKAHGKSMHPFSHSLCQAIKKESELREFHWLKSEMKGRESELRFGVFESMKNHVEGRIWSDKESAEIE